MNKWTFSFQEQDGRIKDTVAACQEQTEPSYESKELAYQALISYLDECLALEKFITTKASLVIIRSDERMKELKERKRLAEIQANRCKLES